MQLTHTGGNMTCQYRPRTFRFRSLQMKVSAACLLAMTLAACGGGSDDLSAAGALTSAKTTSVGADKGKADDAVKGGRAALYDPRLDSNNPAMKKLARLRCEREISGAQADDKGRHVNLPTRKMRRELCRGETETPG